jgi:hypothetical protein
MLFYVLFFTCGGNYTVRLRHPHNHHRDDCGAFSDHRGHCHPLDFKLVVLGAWQLVGRGLEHVAPVPSSPLVLPLATVASRTRRCSQFVGRCRFLYHCSSFPPSSWESLSLAVESKTFRSPSHCEHRQCS